MIDHFFQALRLYADYLYLLVVGCYTNVRHKKPSVTMHKQVILTDRIISTAA